MYNTDNLTAQIRNLKENIIGFFVQGKDIRFVMDYQETNQTVDLIYITKYLAVQKEFNIPVNYGKLILFPDGQTMSQMLEDINKYCDFIEQHKL